MKVIARRILIVLLTAILMTLFLCVAVGQRRPAAAQGTEPSIHRDAGIGLVAVTAGGGPYQGLVIGATPSTVLSTTTTARPVTTTTPPSTTVTEAPTTTVAPIPTTGATTTEVPQVVTSTTYLTPTTTVQVPATKQATTLTTTATTVPPTTTTPPTTVPPTTTTTSPLPYKGLDSGTPVGGRPYQGLAIGATHTQDDAESWDPAPAVARAKKVLADATDMQAQDIMGWGAENPEPSPGVYDFSSLDERVALMQSTGAIPVLVLAGAPDWMKGGAPGTTNWSDLAVAPTPSHYADFAALAVTIAKRYPQVHYFVVWNELKGFWDATDNDWDYAAYTDFYNTVYTALKSYNPSLEIGGPYVVMDSYSKASIMSNPSTISGPWGTLDQRDLDVVSYWLTHADGAQFVVVDGPTATRDAGLTTDPVTATEKFTAVDTWLKAHTTLPIWWAEYYVGGNTGQQIAIAQAAALVRMAADGVAAAFMWQPEGDGSSCAGCLYTDTAPVTGGMATISGVTFAKLRNSLANQTWADQDLHSDGTTLVLTGSDGLRITIDGTAGTVTVTGRSGSKWFELAGSLIVVVLIIFMGVGRMKKRSRRSPGPPP
jgi:hypothetical protein